MLGLNEAHRFAQTRRIPLGSWQAWVRVCYHEIVQLHRFRCSWAALLGLTVGMIRALDQADKFAEETSRMFQRPEEHRFLLFFVALADYLSGRTPAALAKTYGGRIGSNIGLRMQRGVPRSLLAWPVDGTTRILTVLGGQQFSVPLARDTDADFFVYLLHGYYVASLDTAALSVLREHANACVDTVAFTALQAADPAIARLMSERSRAECKNVDRQ